MTRTLAFVAVVIGCWALATAVSPYQRARAHVPFEADGRTTSIDLAGSARAFAEPLLVLTARIENESTSRPLMLRAALGDAERSYSLTASGVADVELVWNRGRTSVDGTLSLHGDHPQWRITRLELSNAHGFTRGVVNFSVVPAGQPLPPLSHVTVLAWAAWMGVVWLVVARRVPSGARWLWVPAAAAAVLLVAASLSGLISPYRLVLEPRTFVLCLVGMMAPVCGWLASRSAEVLRRRVASPHLTTAACAAAALLFFGAATAEVNRSYDGNYSGFLRIARAVAERAPFLRERPDLVETLVLHDDGYDGQFMYLMTFDPLLLSFRDTPERYRDVVDFPPYRYGRGGFSLLASALSRGDPTRVPQTMVWLVVAAAGVAAACLSVWARRTGSPWWLPLLVVLVPGYLYSLTVALPEMLASAGLLLGLVTMHKERPVVAILAIGAALLVRETGLVLAIAIVMARTERSLTWRATVLALATAPLALWRLYVGARLYPDWGLSGFAPSPGGFTWPLAGFWELWTRVQDGSHHGSETWAAIVFPMVLCVAAVVAVVVARRTRSIYAVAAVAYAAIALSLNDKVWSHVPSGERATHELFLALLVAGMHVRERHPAMSRGIVALLGVLAFYTLWISPEASVARSALLLIR